MYRRYRVYKRVTVAIIAFFAVALNSAAQEKSMVIGGKSGWPELSRMEGIVAGKGKFGYEAMVLSTNSRQADELTDILVNFEGGVEDASGHYTVTENSLSISENTLMGRGAGLSRGSGGLRLRGGEDTIFGREGQRGSMSIEFWLKPSIAENGEIVFSWRSSRTVVGYPLYQMITASFLGNRLEWSFTNVFNGYVENGGEITLSSYRTIIPGVWMHHAIHFDQESGILEYRINGLLEALRYITTNGHETGGSVYTPVFGVAADIDICPQYTGLIDDFRIQRSSEINSSQKLRLDAYNTEGGRFETQPIMLSKGASIKSIEAVFDEPSQTNVEFFVRSGDNHYNWSDTYPQWIPIKNKRAIEGVSGLYFQLAANLFPDGNGMKSPSVTQIKVNYKEIPAPLAPFKLVATPQDGSVVLSWPQSVDDTAGGYYVFYGERPGEYIGREAVQGGSPIDALKAGTIELTGLKNGKIYYFAIASYSKYDQNIVGDLSKEIFARPAKK